MNREVKITKLDAAKRQVQTAVRLYFNDEDPISVHTLACAAHEIISTLNEKHGNSTMILSDKLINKEYKEEFRKIMSEAKNFFKHADKDPEGALDFNPEQNEIFLLDCCENYQILTGEKVPYFLIYQYWYYSKYPDVIKSLNSDEVKRFEDIRIKFRDNKLLYFSTMLSTVAFLK